MLVTFGDMIGVPIMPPYYGLRLLPYVAGHGRAGSAASCGSGSSATTTSTICTES